MKYISQFMLIRLLYWTFYITRKGYLFIQLKFEGFVSQKLTIHPRSLRSANILFTSFPTEDLWLLITADFNMQTRRTLKPLFRVAQQNFKPTTRLPRQLLPLTIVRKIHRQKTTLLNNAERDGSPEFYQNEASLG